MKGPEGTHAWTVTVGAKGQIVIPKEARTLFSIQPGDTLLLLADEKRGLAIPEKGSFASLFQQVFRENPQVELEFADGQEYSGRLWNRSHLIAFSLGGATDARNIVAGTRAQNVGSNSSASPDGMAYTESLARDWLDSHPDGWLWYSAEPVYSGDAPICREVVVDLRSDDGTLDMRVRVPNAAPEVDIDYSGGTRTCALE